MIDLHPTDDFDFDHFLAQLHAHQLWERTGRRVEFEPPCAELPTRRHYCLDTDPEKMDVMERIIKINNEDARTKVRTKEQAEEDRRRLSEGLGLPYVATRSITVDKIVAALADPVMTYGRINVTKTAAKHGVPPGSITSFLRQQTKRMDTE